MITRTALVNKLTNIVENVSDVNDEAPIPEDVADKYILIQSESVGVGDIWDGKDFIKTSPDTATLNQFKDLNDKIDELTRQLSELKASQEKITTTMKAAEEKLK